MTVQFAGTVPFKVTSNASQWGFQAPFCVLWVLCSGARWQALPERAIRLAENWITSREYQRQQALRAVAEEQEEYTVKE